MGAGHRVDFPAGRPLPEPGGEVWITEGVKKADALVSRGIYCLALPGVDTWSGTEAINDLKGVDWRGRTVVIAFDSDVATNPRVGKAREALAGFLQDRKAFIRYLDLPSGPKDQKQGIDDYFVSGHTLDDVYALVSDPPSPSPPDQVSQAWMGQLDRTPTGRLVPNARTLGLIIRNDPTFGDLRYDEFVGQVCLGTKTIDDPTLFRLSERIESAYGRGATVPLARLREAVESVGREGPIHPIRDWLGSLVWDGTERIGTLFPVYYGAQDNEYVRAVGRNFLVGAIARIMRPGCKLDTMPILEGPQGILKSSSVQDLFGEGWFAELKSDLHSKDFESGLLGIWCLEFPELESFGRTDINRLKMQLSVRSDWVRLSWRRDTERYPRRCVFVGTTNDDSYLRDPTGARRFWPVRCGQIDIGAIRRDREQLWAEAVRKFRDGGTWWEVPPQAREEQDARYQADSWEEVIVPWLSEKSEVTTTEILEEALEIERGRHDRGAQTRVGNILRRCGWKKVRIRRGMDLAWVYRPPDPVPTSDVGTGWNNVGTSNTYAIVPTVPTEIIPPISPHSPNNSIRGWNVGTSRKNPASEPCSNVVPTEPKMPEIGTDDWTEVAPE